MYQKYHTEALILGNREMSEADRVVALFTRDFGLVHARASAIRSERSKMRYAVQDYARARVSLVKGKRGWRLAGVHGEEKNDYLFAVLTEAHNTLIREHVEASATIEIVCVARVLFALGYLSSEALETALFTHTAYEREHVLEAETMKDKLLSSINKAIAETHL